MHFLLVNCTCSTVIHTRKLFIKLSVLSKPVVPMENNMTLIMDFCQICHKTLRTNSKIKRSAEIKNVCVECAKTLIQ